MNCNNCGEEIPEGAEFCPRCGAAVYQEAPNAYQGRQYAPNGYAQPRPSQTKSTLSLVFGILGLCCFGFIFGSIAILLGILARKDEGPNGTNAVGLVLGFIDILAWIIIVVFFWSMIASLMYFY